MSEVLSQQIGQGLFDFRSVHASHDAGLEGKLSSHGQVSGKTSLHAQHSAVAGSTRPCSARHVHFRTWHCYPQ